MCDTKIIIFGIVSLLHTVLGRPGYGGIASYAPAHVVDYHHHPKYSFKYGVQDLHTGDVKSQHESRDGDVVKGQYSLVEPDGSIRTVDYTADPIHGFNAVVSKTPPLLPSHPVHVPVVPNIVKSVIPVHAPVHAPLQVLKTVAPVAVAPAQYVQKSVVASPLVHNVQPVYSNLANYGDYETQYGGYDLDQLYDVHGGYGGYGHY